MANYYKSNEAHGKDYSSQWQASHASPGNSSEIRQRQHEDYERRGILIKDSLSSLTTGSTFGNAEAGSKRDFALDEQADYDDYGYSSDD